MQHPYDNRHYHYTSPELFSYCKTETSYPLNNCSFILFPSLWRLPSYILTSLSASYIGRIIQYLSFCDWLMLFSVMSLRFNQKWKWKSDSLRPHGILQARILEWVAYPFSCGSYRPRSQTWVSCIADRFFTNWAIREALKVYPSCSILPSSFFRLSILFSIYSEVELLNYVVRLFFFFWNYRFIPSAEHKRFSFPTSTPVLAVFIAAILKGLKFYCIFAGHFTSLLGIGGTKMMLFA